MSKRSNFDSLKDFRKQCVNNLSEDRFELSSFQSFSWKKSPIAWQKIWKTREKSRISQLERLEKQKLEKTSNVTETTQESLETRESCENIQI